MSETRDAATGLARSLTIPLLYLVGVCAFLPVGTGFQFSYDEGVNLIKALLVADGSALYTQVWSDQPPLLTYALSGLYAAFGPSVLAARLLILGLAGALLWAFHGTLRQTLGALPAFLASLGLVFSRHFVRLSVSVMIGLPALAFAVLAFYALARYAKTGRAVLLVVSGLLFALGLQVKLFFAFTLPIALLQVVLTPRGDEPGVHWRSRARAGLVWLAAVAVGAAPLFFLLGPEGWSQLVAAHVGDEVRRAFADQPHTRDFIQLFAYHQPVLALAAVGGVGIVRRREVQGLVPLLWLPSAALALWHHSPIWFHHVLLISIPLFWLAGYGCRDCLRLCEGFPVSIPFVALDGRSRLAALFLAGCVAVSLSTLSMAFQRSIWIVVHPEPPCVQELRDRVIAERERTRWMWTDQPIFAYYADLPVPPEIAVFTKKRVLSGALSGDEMLRTLREYRPEQLLIGRFQYADDFMAYVGANFTSTQTCGLRTHYLANRLLVDSG